MNAVDDYAIQSHNQGFCEKPLLSWKQSQAFVFFFSLRIQVCLTFSVRQVRK